MQLYPKKKKPTNFVIGTQLDEYLEKQAQSGMQSHLPWLSYFYVELAVTGERTSPKDSRLRLLMSPGACSQREAA